MEVVAGGDGAEGADDRVDGDDGDDGDDGGPGTRTWLARTLTQAYRLTEEDRRTVEELGPGTALLLGIGGPMRGQRLLLVRDDLLVGRDVACGVALSDRSVSRVHARLTRVGDGYTVTDAGSLNGTWVNGVSTGERALLDGDEVHFGACHFLYVPGPREGAASTRGDDAPA